MAHTLFRFGIDPSDPTKPTAIPTSITTNAEIELLWSSWCDLIYTTLTGDGTRSIHYLGTSLNASQRLHFPNLPKMPGPSGISEASTRVRSHLHFFGTAMHDGVRGCIADNKVFVYNTPAEEIAMETHRDVDSWNIPYQLYDSIAQVSMCNDESLLVATRPGQGSALNPSVSALDSTPCTLSETEDSETEDNKYNRHQVSGMIEHWPCSITHVPNLQAFQNYCEKNVPGKSLAPFAPIQLVTNATTATALDQRGIVYTYTTDPRYSSCLGRPNTGRPIFEPVPFLSETAVNKIASGGYMTAAISKDGELFLWGQANPGSSEELGVLRGPDGGFDAAERVGTSILCEGIQDDDVKCLSVFIGGEEARAYDVAIGSGHILVAAEDGSGKNVVFCAGRAAEGQLGLHSTFEFCKEFVQVKELAGKRVQQLMASGWSSFVVVEG